jgi:transcriptional regulator with XRE-family HTH domain
LAEMRTSAGLTQAGLAAAFGVSQARISQIEHGQVDSPDTLRAYAEEDGHGDSAAGGAERTCPATGCRADERARQSGHRRLKEHRWRSWTPYPLVLDLVAALTASARLWGRVGNTSAHAEFADAGRRRPGPLVRHVQGRGEIIAR